MNKILRQLIRETLLTEARWTPQTLVDGGYRVRGGGTPTIDALKRLGLIDFK